MEPRASDGVSLHEVEERDLEVFFEHQRESEAVRMAAFPARDREAFHAHWRTKVLPLSSVAKKTIVFDGRVAGYVLSWEQNGRRQVGYWIGKEFWGRGIATAALSAFLRRVTERPLYAYVATHNAASIRVLEKCGFRPSREAGAHAVGPDGVEEVLMELT